LQNELISLFLSLDWAVSYKENSESKKKIIKREIFYSIKDLLLCKSTVFEFSLTAKY
jgi:hypothetical protein